MILSQSLLLSKAGRDEYDKSGYFLADSSKPNQSRKRDLY